MEPSEFPHRTPRFKLLASDLPEWMCMVTFGYLVYFSSSTDDWFYLLVIFGILIGCWKLIFRGNSVTQKSLHIYKFVSAVVFSAVGGFLLLQSSDLLVDALALILFVLSSVRFMTAIKALTS